MGSKTVTRVVIRMESLFMAQQLVLFIVELKGHLETQLIHLRHDHCFFHDVLFVDSGDCEQGDAGDPIYF